MKLGMEVGLGLRQIVLKGDPAPLPKGAHLQFSAMSVVAKRLDGSRFSLVEIGLGPDHTVLDGDPVPPPPTGYSPNCRPTPVVAKRLDGSRFRLVGRYGLSPATLS